MNEDMSMDEREALLKKREEEVGRRELKALARETLAQRGLSPEAESMLDYTDREKCLSSIDRTEKLVRQEAARLLEKRLAAQGAPLPGAGAFLDEDALSDREYYAMKLGGTAR